jgi:hypothetical protein
MIDCSAGEDRWNIVFHFVTILLPITCMFYYAAPAGTNVESTLNLGLGIDSTLIKRSFNIVGLLGLDT